MVIQRMGREAVLEQAVRDSLPEWYEEALLRSGVSTVGDPKLDLDELPAADEPLRFSIEVGVTPKAKLGDYKGSRSAGASPRSRRRRSTRSSSACASRFARVESVDRPARSRATSRWSTSSAASTASRSRAARRATTCSSSAAASWSRASRSSSWAQARASSARSSSTSRRTTRPRTCRERREFEVEVKDVQEKQLPELDDDFASEASDFDTLDELRADIEHKLRHAQEHSIEDEFREAVARRRAAEAEVDLPDDLVTARAEEMWDRTEHALRTRASTPDGIPCRRPGRRARR